MSTAALAEPRGPTAFAAAPGEEPLPAWQASPRYCDRPLDWRTRLFGMGGTAGVFLLILGGALLAWQAVQPMIAPPAVAVFDVAPPAAPDQPVEEVPEGPRQVEQQARKPKEQVERPEPPRIVVLPPSPVAIPAPPPAEPVQAADPVPETTAPKSLPAPPANRVSNNAKATWEGLLLAHLEKYRRYPGASRSRREQGVVHVRFRMNRQGQVLSASVIQSSGFPALDQAALDTLRRAQPLPAIPEDKPDELTLTIPVEFFLRGR